MDANPGESSCPEGSSHDQRRSREQVTQTPEGETEDEVAGTLGDRGRRGATELAPLTCCDRWVAPPS